MYAVTNCRIYTGYEILDNHAVLIDKGRIAQVCPQRDLPKNIPVEDLQNTFLAPGFIDLQVNGCGGVQFNETLEALSVTTLEKMQQTNVANGCTNYLPTVISSDDDYMRHAVRTMREYLQTHKHQALGLHLEGPYINIEKKGIHNSVHIRKPNHEMITFLCDNAESIKLLTLAPECVEPTVIQQLSASGIRVAVGHSNATYNECCAGFAAGICFATHLFNAMPPMLGRESGVVGAVYGTPHIYAGIIADGLHVSWENIRTSHKVKQDKLLLVTDAMLLAGTNIPSTTFGGKTVYAKEGACVDAQNTLGGSTVTMIQAVENTVSFVGLPLDEALRMATLYPARAIGIDADFGSIEAGKIAHLVVFNRHFAVQKTIVNGELSR